MIRPASVGSQLMGQSPVIPRPVSMVLVVAILLIPKFLPIWPARVGVTSKRAKIIKLELYSSLLSTETNHANAATTWMFPVRRRPVLTGKVVAILPLVFLHSQYLPVGWGTAGVIGENYQQVKDITRPLSVVARPVNVGRRRRLSVN